MTGLSNRRVLITAGASGIGAATARQFVAQGARVHICDIDRAAVDGFLETMPAVGATLADVADEQAVERLFRTVEDELGGLDFLINCAGIAGPTACVEDIDYAGWQRCLDVNLGGAMLCSRKAIPMLKASGGGAIVNLSSTAGLAGYPARAPYCAAKWAIIGFTKTLASELGGFGIRSNAICPGSVDGVRMDRVIAAEAANTGLSEDEVRQGYVADSAMGTFVSEDDIAAMILFVCSDAGARVSGQALSVCGHTV